MFYRSQVLYLLPSIPLSFNTDIFIHRVGLDQNRLIRFGDYFEKKRMQMTRRASQEDVSA